MVNEIWREKLFSVNGKMKTVKDYYEMMLMKFLRQFGDFSVWEDWVFSHGPLDLKK